MPRGRMSHRERLLAASRRQEVDKATSPQRRSMDAPWRRAGRDDDSRLRYPVVINPQSEIHDRQSNHASHALGWRAIAAVARQIASASAASGLNPRRARMTSFDIISI